MGAPIRDFYCIPSDEMIKKYDDYDYISWLHKNNVRLDSDELAVKLTQEAAIIMGINLIELISASLAFETPNQKWSAPAKGFDSIPKAMANEFEKKLKGKIQLNSEVRKIKRANVGENNEKV